MVKDGKDLNLSTGGQFDSHNVARMSPVFPYAHRLGMGVGGVENKQIGIPDKIDEGVILAMSLIFMLGIR